MTSNRNDWYCPGDTIVGDLRVEALLGEGGAGAVYRVRDERKGTRLALKQLRAKNDEHKALLTSQFAREYHTLSQLAHPRIIEVHDYGVDRGCPYYTMELLDGEDLHDRGKLPYQTACALLCDVASSLAMLHSRGLIHRDVSARNVRCTSDGRAKLLDFGAMVPAGSIQRAVGTPPFVAPEVLQMQALDARTDLYGLGALAYWTLTGRHAYGAQTFDQLRDAWRKPPPHLDGFVFAELLLHHIADNLTGVKRARVRIEQGVRVFPRWRVVESVAQAHYLRLQGDAAAALSALQPALDSTVAGRNVSWSLTRYAHIRLLLSLGRNEEAAQFGVRYLDEATRCSLQPSFKGVVAEAFAGAGRIEEAEHIADEHLAELHALGERGVWLGLGYEARAWVAIAMRDAATFKVCAEHCAELYLRGRGPGMRARHERLRNAAAEARLIATDRLDPGHGEPPAQPSAEDEARTVYSRMLTAISPVERAERALQLLLEATGARTGYFFGLRSGKLQLLFNPEQDAPTRALTEILEAYLERELADFAPAPSTSTAAIVAHPIAAPLGSFIDESGREFEPLVLAGLHHGEAMIAGVAALHYPEDDRPPARRAMLDAVIEALIADAVVDPITCVT